jgi:hypothetical protein
VRSLNDAPAESEGLKAGVDALLQIRRGRKENKRAADCRQSVHLFDAVAHLVAGLDKLLGRRVILVLSDGEDKGSRHSWNEVKTFAGAAGVAVFGLKYVPQYARDQAHTSPRWSSEASFLSLCELSGGLVFLTSSYSLEEQLKRFVTTLRERYIVEFPRPAHSTSGAHGIEVKIAKAAEDFIRPAGISVPIPDAALLADPTTVPSDPSLTPMQGTGKIVAKPK